MRTVGEAAWPTWPAATAAVNESESLQFVRLQLPGMRRPVHVLREFGRATEDGPWSGSDPVLTAGGAVLAAHSHKRLLREHPARHRLTSAAVPVLVFDLKRGRKAMSRPHGSWSGPVRGTVVDLDDLLWDTAASLADAAAGSRVKDDDGFHAQYLYVWGRRPAPLPAEERVRHWDEMLAWFSSRLVVLDRHDARFARRR